MISELEQKYKEAYEELKKKALNEFDSVFDAAYWVQEEMKKRSLFPAMRPASRIIKMESLDCYKNS